MEEKYSQTEREEALKLAKLSFYSKGISTGFLIATGLKNLGELLSNRHDYLPDVGDCTLIGMSFLVYGLSTVLYRKNDDKTLLNDTSDLEKKL